MGNNSNLHRARKNNYDEYYTQLSDIQEELRHFTPHFKGKTVFCNCDDPFESNFTLYFLMNFNRLGLKRLISTGYATSPIAGNKLKVGGAYCLDVSDTKHALRGRQTDLNEIDAEYMLVSEPELITVLNGDDKYPAGDFRSKESIELLKQSDIVVGNPPFSIAREAYLPQVFEYDKKFILIGNKNWITYKSIWPTIKDKKMWLGTPFANGNAFFYAPNANPDDFAKGVYNPQNKMVKFRNCNWYTNLDYTERHQTLRLGCVYKGHEEEYYPYDNYEGIDIGKFDSKGRRVGDNSKIPYDYDGVMGVSITILDKYCPEQFEILGITCRGYSPEYVTKIYQKTDYKNANDLNGSACIIVNNEPLLVYGRVLIRNRHPGRCDWDAWDREIIEKMKGASS